MGGEWYFWTFWNEEKRNKFFWKDMSSQLKCRLLPQYCNVMCLPTQTFTLCNVHVNTLSSTKETAPLGLLNIRVSVLPVTQHLSSDVHRLGSSPSVQKKRDNAASIKMRILCLHLSVYLWSDSPYGLLLQLLKETHPWHALMVFCKRLKWHKYK